MFIQLCYYPTILAWAFFYLTQSWKNCGNWWNEETTCLSNFTGVANATNYTTAVREYWELVTKHNSNRFFFSYKWEIFYRRRVLQITDGIDNLGGMRWELVGCLFVVWIVCYFTIFQGTKSTGKVVSKQLYTFLISILGIFLNQLCHLLSINYFLAIKCFRDFVII